MIRSAVAREGTAKLREHTVTVDDVACNTHSGKARKERREGKVHTSDSDKFCKRPERRGDGYGWVREGWKRKG